MNDKGGDMDTISTVLNDLRQESRDNQFAIDQYGFITLRGKIYTEDEIRIIRTYRFEGNSDPADAAIIYLVEANDGMIGYSLDAYGVYTNYANEYTNTIRSMNYIKESRHEVTID